jgi:hypothetical protein
MVIAQWEDAARGSAACGFWLSKALLVLLSSFRHAGFARPRGCESSTGSLACRMTDRTAFANLNARKLEAMFTWQKCGRRVVAEGFRPELRNQLQPAVPMPRLR